MHNINGRLRLSHGLKRKELSLALDTALFMGFSTISAEFPVTSYTEGDRPAASLQELLRYCPADQKLSDDYVSSTRSAHPVPEFARKNTGLEGLFLSKDFLLDENLDCLPDRINFRILLPDPCSDLIAEAACNFAFRTGMEVTSCRSGILADAGYRGNSVIFEEAENSGIFYEEDEFAHVRIRCGGDIVPFICRVLNQFPELSYGISWEKYLKELSNSLNLKNLDGQLALARSVYEKTGQVSEVYCEPSCQHMNPGIEEMIPGAKFVSFKGLKKAYTQEFEIDWEKDVFSRILEEKVYPNVQAGDRVEIYGSLSEDREVRENLTREIRAGLESRGAEADTIQITCAYKQGFSWIEDFVLPRLENLGVKKVTVWFKPFLPEGQTEWKDEDGATPSSNIGGSDPDKWYDLPIRFLQELYPVDDLIAEKLGISCDDVEFRASEGSGDATYHLSAMDETGKEVYSDSYTVNVNERPYLDDYPAMGKVHPATGCIRALVNGREILSEKILTDIERIWECFNRDVLKKCAEHILEKSKDPDADQQPFFSQLRLEAYVSEPERQLSSRQDLISPLDALHEDMYFVATDYFKNMGMAACGKPFDAPGLILPVLHVRDGRPSFTATMYDKASEKPCVIAGDTVYTVPAGEKTVKLQGLISGPDGIRAQILVSGADPDQLKAYALLLEKGLLHVNGFLKGIREITFLIGNEEITAVLPPYEEPRKDLCITDLDLPETRVIGYTEYLRIMEQLKHVPGIGVYEAGRSYSDRIIYAVDLLPSYAGNYVSRTKRLTMFPSELANCRHHANEVSSTNACFKVIRELLTNADYRTLADEINLTFVPVENPDGTAIHEELSREHPLWKLHVARFDALSKEFFHEIFNPDTIHTEANAFFSLYENRLPDLVVDNHGVPSHEWEQQYSGYTSPSFKGFWLPRSILYGYFWTVPQEEFRDNIQLCKEIEHQVAVSIEKDREMTDLNIEMAAKFEKYAHNWMPRLFPANYYMHMINYWVSRNFDMTQKYVSWRHPWLTTTYYTSEVADETAQGEYLALCTRAHYTHNLAILNIMRHAETVIEASCSCDGKDAAASCVRHRPVVIR